MRNLDIWAILMNMDPSQGSFDMPLVQISDDKVFVEDNNGIDQVFVDDNNGIDKVFVEDNNGIKPVDSKYSPKRKCVISLDGARYTIGMVTLYIYSYHHLINLFN